MRKLLAALLALTMALSFAACGGENTSTEDPFDKEASSGGVSNAEKDTVTLYTLTEERYYNADGTLMRKIAYSYDDRGLLTRREMDSTEYEQTFNEELMIYEPSSLPCDGIVDLVYTATYDDYGNLTYFETCEGLDESGQLIMKPGNTYTYEYDDNGNAVSYTIVTDEGTTIQSYQYIYDDQGRILQVTRTNDGEPEIIHEFTYDDYGKLVSAFITTNEADILQTYTYDEQGQLTRVEMAYIIDGETFPQSYFEYTYDEHGNYLTKKHYISKSGSLSKEKVYVHSYEGDILVKTETDGRVYTYDAHGNITRVTAEDGSYTEYTFQPIQVAPEDVNLSVGQWYYKQEECFEISLLRLRVEFNDCVVNALLPNLLDNWY